MNNKRSINCEADNGDTESKRAKLDGFVPSTTLAVYRNENDNDDSDEIVEYDESDKMLCIFKPQTETRSITWVDKFTHNLQKKNLTVLRCHTPFNKLFESLGFLNESISLESWIDKLYPQVNDKVVIEPLKPPKLTYKIGVLVKGGMFHFYFFDMVKMKRYKSVYGEFFMITWPNMHVHNKIFGNIMKNHLQEENLKLQNSVLVNLPEDNVSYANKMMFVRKFFNITQSLNEKVFSTGDLVKSVRCEPFTVDTFNDVFQFESNTDPPKPSEEVEMLMGALIEGVKISKNETQFETVTGKKLFEKSYSLSIKPMVFFRIEGVDQ